MPSATTLPVRSPAASVAAYVAAKDGNRPHLIEIAFADRAVVEIDNRTEAIAFPARIEGHAAIADALVRGFARRFENVYTLCLADPPPPGARRLDCPWLVAMSEQGAGTVRVGYGRYRWTFGADGRAERLVIEIDGMTTFAAADAAAAIGWAAGLSYPWCPPGVALATAPAAVRASIGDAIA